MKTITIQVKCCEGCLNQSVYDNLVGDEIVYCRETGKDIKDITIMPDWCPLPDASNLQTKPQTKMPNDSVQR